MTASITRCQTICRLLPEKTSFCRRLERMLKDQQQFCSGALKKLIGWHHQTGKAVRVSIRQRC